MTVILDQVNLNEELSGTRIWQPEISGGFSSKSTFLALHREQGIQDFQFYKIIWRLGIPARIKFFAWSLCLERLNTFDILQRKRSFQCLSPSWCIMCKQDQESIGHLFLYRGYARSLWLKAFREFDLLREIANNLVDLLIGCSYARWNKEVKALWASVAWAVL